MEKIKIGKIVNTKGLKGEAKVYSYAQYKERFAELDSILIEDKSYEIEYVKYYKDMPVIKIKGIDHINDIEKFKDKDIYINRSQAGDVEEDEHFIIDLIGLKVVDEAGQKVGTLKDILTNYAQDIYVIKTGGEDILVPGVKDFIKEINVKDGFVKIHRMEGL